MIGKEPTQEQQNEFWKWCGLFYGWSNDPSTPTNETYGAWFRPMQGKGCIEVSRKVPSIELNNLFKYAVPKLDRCTISMNVAPPGDVFWNAKARLEGGKEYITTRDTPALALFWAIWKARGVMV